MKKYLIMAMAAAAITGCSQDEVMEVAQKQAISFKDAFVENATRAIDATYSNDSKPASFLVYGNTQGDEDDAPVVPIFKGVEVSKNITNGIGETYKYNTDYTQYWIAGNTYNFAAVVHGSVDGNDIVDGLPTKISYDANNNEDLLYTKSIKTTIGKASGNQEVGLIFDHLLSKIKFTVKNTMDPAIKSNNNYFYRVSSVQINEVYEKAEYIVGTGWENQSGTIEKLEFGNICAVGETTANEAALKIGAGQSGESNYEKLLIPATYDALNITCTIETLILDGSNYKVINSQNYSTPAAAATNKVTKTFEEGKAYNLLITLGNPGEPIKFKVASINEWGNGNTEDSDNNNVNDYVTLVELNQN